MGTTTSEEREKIRNRNKYARPTDEDVRRSMIDSYIAENKDKKIHKEIVIKELSDMCYTDYLKTPHWREKRKYVLESKGRICIECGSTKKLDVHHLTYKNFGDELMDDLVVICRDCHKKLHEEERKAKVLFEKEYAQREIDRYRYNMSHIYGKTKKERQQDKWLGNNIQERKPIEKERIKPDIINNQYIKRKIGG